MNHYVTDVTNEAKVSKNVVIFKAHVHAGMRAKFRWRKAYRDVRKLHRGVSQMPHRVLLVNPPPSSQYVSRESTPILPPLGLAYIAAVLRRAGIDVQILDMNALNLSLGDLLNNIRRFSPSIVGFTAVTPAINLVKNFANAIKEESKGTMIVIGGPHASALPDETLNDSNIDVVVRGEGETTMLELAERRNPKSILGISHNLEKLRQHNPNRPPIRNLDEFPFPARDLLPNERYWTPGIKRKPFTTILTSRGCPNHCNFCQHSVFGYIWRPRSPQNVLSEIDYLVENYKVKEIDIIDDGFTLDVNRAMKICALLIQRRYNLIWRCSNGIRVDRITKELLNMMWEAGCRSIAFGVETGDEMILRRIHKGVTLEQVKKAFAQCKQIGIETTAFFIIGNVGDNERSISKTIKFAKALDADYYHFGVLVPLPGTEAYEYIKQHGHFLTLDWEKYGQFEEPVFECEHCTKEFMADAQRRT